MWIHWIVKIFVQLVTNLVSVNPEHFPCASADILGWIKFCKNVYKSCLRSVNVHLAFLVLSGVSCCVLNIINKLNLLLSRNLWWLRLSSVFKITMQLSFSGPKTWELESTYYIFLQIVCYLSMWIECNFHIYCQAPGQAQGPNSKTDGPWSEPRPIHHNFLKLNINRFQPSISSKFRQGT